MASEAEVEAVAKVLADTPLISEPKLEFYCWMGTARACLEAAERVRLQAMVAPSPTTPLPHPDIGN
jgi:hypothetical protein